MKKEIIITFLLLATSHVLFSQREFHISHYMVHQPFINPSSMGSYNAINGAALFKKQWVGFDGSPSIQALDVNMPIQETDHHAGLTIIQDKLGVHRTLDIGASYAYRLKIDDNQSISLGMRAIAEIQQDDYTNLPVNDPNDPVFTPGKQNFTRPNFSFGAYYTRTSFYAGFAIPKFFNTTYELSGVTSKIVSEFTPKNWHYYIHAGKRFDINEQFDLNTSVLLKEVTGAPLQFDINAQALYNKKIGLGLSYRSSKELALMLSYQLTDQFLLSYSYDFSFSNLSAHHGGTHEIMLLFVLANKDLIGITTPRF